MTHFIPNWFNSTTYHNFHSHRNSFFNETIVTVALSALAFITGEILKDPFPALALLFRCTAGGVGLIWIFRRIYAVTNSYPPRPRGSRSFSGQNVEGDVSREYNVSHQAPLYPDLSPHAPNPYVPYVPFPSVQPYVSIQPHTNHSAPLHPAPAYRMPDHRSGSNERPLFEAAKTRH